MDNDKLSSDVARVIDDQPDSPDDFDTESQLVSLLESPSFQKSFSNQTTTSDRIKFVLSHESMSLVIAKIVCDARDNSRDCKKCGTQAAEFGQAGIRAFQEQRYGDALVFYSKAIRYAPHDSGLLPIAFGSRSGAFFQLKQYDAALKDIEAAQSHPQYKQFFMLTIRKCQCLVRLGRVAQAKEIIDSIKDDDFDKGDAALLTKFYKQEGEKLKDVKDDEDGASQKDIEPELLRNVSSVIKILSEKGRFESQSTNSSLSAKIEVRFDEKNGRHLVTTQDVRFGDILAVTKPYASVLSEKQELLFCHYCLISLKPILDNFPRSVPCTQCTRVLYCSEHCCTESWKLYHRFECPLSVYSFDQTFADNSPPLYLALRTWLVAGGLESIRSVTQKFDATENPAKSADFADNPIGCYENVYRMKMKKSEHIKELIKKVVLATILFKWSKFYENDDIDGAPSEKDIFTIKTFLRHYRQILSNDSQFVRGDQSALLHPNASDESIWTLDPLISLVRRSCDPNISIIGVDCAKAAPHVSNVCVFFAIKPIPAGTVLSAVGPRYGDSVKFRIYLYEFVRALQEAWMQPETHYICPCEHCEDKRRDNPLGSSTNTSEDHELVFCGTACGGFIRRTDDQVNCSVCNREIGHDELTDLKKISSDISKMHSQAVDLIARIKALIVDNQKKSNVPKEKILCSLLRQLETLINDRIAPLAFVHSRLMLVDLYKQLNAFYRYCYKLEPKKKFDRLQKAWKYAEASHSTLEGHFGGGDSLRLLVLLLENVRFFSDEIDELRRGLMEQIGPMVEGNLLEFRLNLNDDNQNEKRNARVRLIDSFNAAQKRLNNLNEFYKMI